MSTISTTVTLGVTLGTGTYTSPLTVTTIGLVDPGTGNAIYGPNSNAWTVVNNGGVTAAGSGGIAIDLLDGGSVTNTRTISGYDSGIVIAGSAGTVSNTGKIIATGTAVTRGDGIYLGAGGSVSNTSTAGLIEGYTAGVVINNAAGTVTNFGTIGAKGGFPGGYGVQLVDGGSVINNAGALIEGYVSGVFAIGVSTVTNLGTITVTDPSGGTGIDLAAGGTVVDSGTITGNSGTAIYFGGTGGNLLVLENGYKLSGSVYGAPGATNTLELGGTVSAAVTVSYTALGLTNFEDVLFGAAGHDTLKVSQTGTILPATISGFTLGSEIIDLTAIGTNGTIAGQSTTLVTVTGSLGSESLKLDASDAAHFTVTSDGVSGTDLGIPCFCRGTLILTDRGEIAVEDLVIGNRVMTFSGTARPIKWIGRRFYDGRFVAANRKVLPICVEAGALGDDIPRRDLWISPEHALYLPLPGAAADGLRARNLLVPAALLVNGGTITRVDRVERLEYFHIELAGHEVILAEGTPAESYVDCDNRMMFQNGGEFARLYPGEAPEPWEFCAERVEPGSAELAAIRAVLLARAAALGHTLEYDPDLHLVVDGGIIRPDAVDNGVYRFTIPPGAADVWLASRSAVPAETADGPCDLRRLGVALNRIVLRDAERVIEASHDDAMLCEGFYEDEGTHRWSDGLARVPEAWVDAFSGAFTLEVQIGQAGLVYHLDPPPGRTRAA